MLHRSRLEQIYLVCKCVLVLSIAFSCVYTPLYITKHVDSQLTGLRNDAKIEIQTTREAAVSEIRDTRKEVVQLVNIRFNSLQGNVTSWLSVADNRIGSLEGNTFQLADNLRTDTFVRMDTLSTNVNSQLTTTNQHIGKLTDTYAALPVQLGAQFNARLGTQTDCSVNKLCYQNLTSDLMIDARYGMRDFSAASNVFTQKFPKFIDNADKITTNFAGITRNIENWTHPRWWEKGLRYAAQGAGIYTTLTPPVQAIKGTISIINTAK